jgi:NTE family protein
LRVFENDELDIDVVLASACLPHYFQAVEIGGVPYWDGGYGGNPAIYPFFYANNVEDVLLIQVNPVVREGTPHSTVEIQNRIDEITFNATLLSEFRAIAFVRELLAESKLSHRDFRDIRMHRIDADAAFKDLSASSKINAEWAFLEYLRDLGRTAAEDWLEESFDQVGKKSTLDLSEELQRKPERGAPQRMGARVRQFLASRVRPAG